MANVQTTVRHATVTAIWLLAFGSALAQSDAQAVAGSGGFEVISVDSEWRLRLRGLVHFDGRWFADESAPDDSEWLLRRVRPSFEGDFGERVSVRIMPDFAGGSASLVDAFIDTRLGGGLTVRVGKFKAPVGLERLQSANDLRLVERSVVTDLLPNRDVGLQVSADQGPLSWAVGLFNGVRDGRSGDEDDDGNQEIAGRLFIEPFGGDSSRLGFGAGATFGKTEGGPLQPLLATYRTPGQNDAFFYRIGVDGTFADGERLRLSPQFYWYGGPFGLLGEWASVRQDVRRIGTTFARAAELEHHAWQLTGEWFVTGQAAGYHDPAAVDAVQLVARFSRLEIDDAAFTGGDSSFANPALAARKADTWAVGLNWFPLAGIKLSLSYHQTTFDGGSPAGDRRDEKVLFARSQLRF